MVADVYAGDTDQPQGTSAGVDVLFLVEADPDPDALARIIAIVSLANRAPANGSIATTETGQLVIAIEMRGVSIATQDLTRRKLAQLTCVVKADAHILRGLPAKQATAAEAP